MGGEGNRLLSSEVDEFSVIELLSITNTSFEASYFNFNIGAVFSAIFPLPPSPKLSVSKYVPKNAAFKVLYLYTFADKSI